MAILAWGKGLLETCALDATGALPATPNWKLIDTPKEGTLKLTSTAGQETNATEEGGEIVDSRKGRTTYSLEFDLYVKKGVARPWADTDGLITGEHAFRYTPEDDGTEGFLIDRSTVSCEESFTVADGKMLHYVVRCLKPSTGKTVKEYVKTGGA